MSLAPPPPALTVRTASSRRQRWAGPGALPLDLTAYGWQILGALACMLIGDTVFMRVKHPFADVI